MLIVLMLLCAAVAILLIGLGAYGELHELWTHPVHRLDDDPRPHPPKYRTSHRF